jgi:uncharacterized membrane protein
MQMKLNKLQPDLLVILLFIFIQIFMVVFNINTFPRAGMGFVYIAFIPGYVLQTLLLDNGRIVYISLRKLILAVPISLSVTVLLGLAGLLFDTKSINNITQVFLIAVFDLVVVGFAYFRRRNTKIRGTINFMIFISVLFLLATSFVIIYPILR